MTGPEHYKIGETLLANAWKRSTSDDTVFIHTPQNRAEIIAVAHAHFTAALAAATAIAVAGDMPIADCEAWEKAARVQPS